jgi:N-acetylmuramoyl-L-alanine amidase
MVHRNGIYLRFGNLVHYLSLFFGLLLPITSWSTTKEPLVVILDPGHGGGDPGATAKLAKRLISEKDIALAIALRTRKNLENPEYWGPLGRPVKAILTRESDRQVSLEDRSAFARRNKALLFVSIHSNADPSRKARGIETFFLNNTTEAVGLKIEEIENRLSKRHAKGNDEQLLIRSVVADAMVEDSRLAAEKIQASSIAHIKSRGFDVHDRGARQALLYVLLDSQVPAVLFEAFFLSHPKDLEFISQPENRQVVAEGLAQGILRYLALQ